MADDLNPSGPDGAPEGEFARAGPEASKPSDRAFLRGASVVEHFEDASHLLVRLGSWRRRHGAAGSSEQLGNGELRPSARDESDEVGASGAT